MQIGWLGFSGAQAPKGQEASRSEETSGFKRVMKAASQADGVQADGGKETAAAADTSDTTETEPDNELGLDDAEQQNSAQEDPDSAPDEGADKWILHLLDGIDDTDDTDGTEEAAEVDPSILMVDAAVAPIVVNAAGAAVELAAAKPGEPVTVLASAGISEPVAGFFASKGGDQAIPAQGDPGSPAVDLVAPEAVGDAVSAAGRIALPIGMVAQSAEVLPVVNLNASAAVERLTELVDAHLRSGRSPTGGKQLSLLLHPEGLGRLRILAQTDASGLRVRLEVENAEAARMLERILPQMEARLAAQMALPVQFEVLTDEHQANSDELGFSDPPPSDSDPEQEGQEAGEEALIDEWTQALEDRPLELGQQLHVVV